MTHKWNRFTSDRVWKLTNKCSAFVGVGDDDRYYWWIVMSPGFRARDYGTKHTLKGAMEAAERTAVRFLVMGY